MERKESRGGHFRDDFPDKDPAFASFNHVISKGTDGNMHLRRQPIPELRADLQAVVEENK